MKKSVVLINVLPPQTFNDCHIPSSINIPVDNLEAASKKLSKDQEIIVYCARYTCNASRNAWHMLKKLGFDNVKAFEGGMLEWYQAGLPSEGACKLDYLNAENIKSENVDNDVATITRDELKKKLGLTPIKGSS